MSYLNSDDILRLSQASRDYNKLLDPVPDNDALLYKDLNKFTYGQTASILRNNYGLDANPEGVSGKLLNDEEFVIGWVLNEDHPERKGFIPYIDADLSETLFPLSTEEELTGWTKRFGSYGNIAFSAYANAPPWFTGSLKTHDMYKHSYLAWREVDWKEMGSKLFHGDVGGMASDWFEAWQRYQENYSEGKYDFVAKGGIPTPLLRSGLGEMEKLLAERAKFVMEEHQKNPKNRAYLQYMNQLTAKELLYGDDAMSFEEHIDYLTAALASPVMTIGSGVVAGLITRNPAIGMQVASSGAFLLEGIDEWQQSFDYYSGLGYSPENASRMSHASALLYGAAAFYTERLPASRFIPGANKVLGKKRLWDGIVKYGGAQTEKAFLKFPKLKTVVSNRGTRMIKNGFLNGATESLQEGIQFNIQTAIQYGYKGNEAFEGYSAELRESMRAGGVAGLAMGPLAGGISGTTKYAMKKLAKEEEAKAELGKEPAITELDRDKIKIASVTNLVDKLTKDEKKLAGTLVSEEREAESVLRSIKKKGADILNELGVTSDELVTQVKDLFGPERAAEAKKYLTITPTTTVKKEAEEKPITEVISPFGEEGISDTDLDAMLAEEEEEGVEAPDYTTMKVPELKQAVKARGLTLSEAGKPLNKEALIKRLRADDATQAVETIVPEVEGEVIYADPETGEPLSAEEIADIEAKKAPVVAEEAPVKKTVEEMIVEGEILGTPKTEIISYLQDKGETLVSSPEIDKQFKPGMTDMLDSQGLLTSDPEGSGKYIINQGQVIPMLGAPAEEIPAGMVRVPDTFVEPSHLMKREEAEQRLEYIVQSGTYMGEDGVQDQVLIQDEAKALREALAVEEAPVEEKGPEDQIDIPFQAIDAGILPKATEERAWADRVITSLKERFPRIEGRAVEKIVNQLTGEEQAGRAFNMIAEWSKEQATVDTAPHEYGHILIDALEDHPLIKSSILEYGSKEALVQYMGEYYADGMKEHDKGLRSRFKTFLRKFWAQVKKTFGKPAEYVAQQFAEGGELFQGADAIAAAQYKLRGQKLVNEASFELDRLKKEHGVTIKRHPTDPTRLGTVVVPEKARRQGIGTRVFDALKNEFIGKGKDVINIEVNPGSEGFWQKMGFTKTGEREGRWLMQYNIPAEEMTLGPIQYQMVSHDTEGGRMAMRMMDNALNAMQAQLGKRFVIKDLINRIAETIPPSFAEVFTYWADKHIDLNKAVKSMAIFDSYATTEEFNEAFYDVNDALEEDLRSIEPNDFAIRAKNMATVEYAFMHALGIDMPKERINYLLGQAIRYGRRTDITPQEAFAEWADAALGKVTQFRYSDIPDTKKGRIQKRRIKQLYVRANSSVLVNPSSALIPRHRNLIYNASGDGLVWKSNTHQFTKDKNDTAAINYIYEAVNADKQWDNKPVWLNISDIVQLYYKGRANWFDKRSSPLTADEIRKLAKRALNLKWDGMGVQIHGLAMLSVRGDSGHFIFAPILDKHINQARKMDAVEAYWRKEAAEGNITSDQFYHFMGFRKDANGQWQQLKNASNVQWLAGEMARYEMMRDMMPADLNKKDKKGAMSWMSKGSEFFRRIKILSTPVFTSPLMRDFKSMIIAKGDQEKGEILFVDRNGNEAPMVDVIRGLGRKNRTDGASIISRIMSNDMQDAFGSDPTRKVFKTAIWKADLSLAVKNEMFLPEFGMKIIRKKADGERITIAEVDDTGRIFQIEGEKRTEVDMLLTDDEAKHSTYKTGEIIDVKGNELGLIKYHESKVNRAKFPHQWLNYVHDKETLAELRKTILPRVRDGLGRLFNLTSSDKMRPAILAKYMMSLRSDSPHSITTALIEKAKLNLGLHPDAFPMLNKLMKTQIIDPSLQLADGKGAYLDIAPDYFDTHKDDDVSIAQADAKEVFKAYAKKEGGTWQDAQNIGLNAINKWLENNEVKALISRSPIPYVGGVFVGRIKSIHDRGGQIVMSSENLIRRLEGDTDGDAVQIEFLPAKTLEVFDKYLQESQDDGRMGAVNLDSYMIETEEVNDLSKVENAYNLANKFQKGARAIGEIANIQNVLGQLVHVFNHIETDQGKIKVYKLDDQVYFPEIDETKSMEEQLRIWLQAAVDNGKHLLLDTWNYDRATLIGRLFYMEDAEGNTRTLTESETEIVKKLVSKHVIPGRIRNGRQPDFAYSVNTLLADSKEYLDYTKNRADQIRIELEESADIHESIGEISFNEELAPLEEIAISFAQMWYGDGNIEARIEPGKITPVEFEKNVYKTIHLNTMREMEDNFEATLQDRIDAMDSLELPNRDEATILSMLKKGQDYANAMWLDEKDGFIKLLAEFNEAIGPSSWDHNPELIKWTQMWSEKFKDFNDIEKLGATYGFFRGFAQLNEQGTMVYDDNRSILPPISDQANFTVLDHRVAKEYLTSYDSNLRKTMERTEDSRKIRYAPFSHFVKKVCK